MSWFWWLAIGYVGGRFGEAIVTWAWGYAKGRKWV